MSAGAARRVKQLAAGAAGLVFAQSMLGAFVRHSDAGAACLDIPLCLGRVVPPLVNTPITVHFLHRAIAVVATVVVIGLAAWARRTGVPKPLRSALDLAALLVVVQFGLGVASILTVLAVTPVSLHSLGAALLTVVLVHVATRAHLATKCEGAAARPTDAELVAKA